MASEWLKTWPDVHAKKEQYRITGSEGFELLSDPSVEVLDVSHIPHEKVASYINQLRRENARLQQENERLTAVESGFVLMQLYPEEARSNAGEEAQPAGADPWER